MGAPLEYKAPLLNSSVHHLINGGGSDDGGGGAAAVEACTGIPSVPLSWSRTNASIERPEKVVETEEGVWKKRARQGKRLPRKASEVADYPLK
jgi:hypothetical protein